MRSLGFTALLLVLAAEPLAAHHGTFTFDVERILTLEGRVVRFNWTNPHSAIVLAVDQPDGSIREYLVEGDGPSILQPLGVTRDSLQPGDRVIAYVSPGRRPEARSVLGREFIKEDGTVLGISVAYTRQLEQRGLVAATSVLGTWVPDQRALFQFVQNSADWALTPSGADAMASYDNTAPFAQTACIPATAPVLMMYPTAKVVVQEEDRIVLNVDWMGAQRIIHMNDKTHPEAGLQLAQGYSIGRWEGSTLYVDTRNFSPNPIGNMFSLPSGKDKHLQEWFTLAGNGQSLSYRYVLEDPGYLARSVAGEHEWRHRPDLSPSTEPCDIDAAAQHLAH